MLSVAQATDFIQQHLLQLPTEAVPLSQAAGRVLREPLVADRDLPPFDRVTMDGIAFRYERYAAGQRRFRIEGTQYAGQPGRALAGEDTCLEAMTGAVLPAGTDTIVRYEDLRLADGWAEILVETVQPGQNIHRRASDRPVGDVLVQPSIRLSPAELAVAASVGHARVEVTARPRLALVSTGDELVEVDEIPEPHQIRRSNVYFLQAALEAAGAVTERFHLPDEVGAMEGGLGRLLEEFDALVLSGGVSAGKADFVPQVLERLGVRKVFHQVAQRPGKPLWFGATAAGKPVFGLPGNPVSTFLCTYRYLRPWLRASLGEARAAVPMARLAEPVLFKPALTYFLPVSLRMGADAVLEARPFPGGGSGDYANLLRCDGFLELPAGESEFAVGEVFPVWGFR